MRSFGVILWASFLLAIFAEGCFFVIIDPNQALVFGDFSSWRKTATIVFFFFWICGALASALSGYLITMPARRRK
jgi:hypothetical protein